MADENHTTVCPYHGKTTALLESALKKDEQQCQAINEIHKDINEINKTCATTRQSFSDALDTKRQHLKEEILEEVDEVRAEVSQRVHLKLFYVLISILIAVCGFLYTEQRQTNSTLIDIKIGLEVTMRELSITSNLLDKHIMQTDDWKKTVERRLDRGEK